MDVEVIENTTVAMHGGTDNARHLSAVRSATDW